MEPAARWRPVGTVLVENGSITQEQLDAALQEQRQTGKKIGEILIATGAITWLTLAHAIAEQAQEMGGGGPAPAPAPAPPPVVEEAPEPLLDWDADNPTATATRLREVEALLKERQRAFLDLVSVTETLRATIARLQEELATRNAELARFRAGEA
jgi:uncharacterized small protein (DUF1192 family)